MSNKSILISAKNSSILIPNNRSVLRPNYQNPLVQHMTVLDPFFLSIVLIFAVVGNLYLAITIIYDKRLQSSINLLLMINCTANVLLCLSTLLPAILALTKDRWTVSQNLCQLIAFSYRMLSFYAFANLATISIDRLKTFTDHRYQLPMQRVIWSQLLLFVIALTLALPWSTFYDNATVLAQFSSGYLKCRSVLKYQQIPPVWITETVCRLILSQVAPLAIIIFCSVKVFKRVKARYNCVAPAVISTENGYPVGCYLKSALTNLLLITFFVLLRSPELTMISFENVYAVKPHIYIQRTLSYLTWLQCALHPIICIARNSALLQKIASSCFGIKINHLLFRSERRKKQYEVEQEFTTICFEGSTNSINSDLMSPSVLNFAARKSAWP